MSAFTILVGNKNYMYCIEEEFHFGCTSFIVDTYNKLYNIYKSLMCNL